MHTWLLAAKWQFEECDSPDECRKYLLQACTKFEYDVRILVELFHAEMLTAEKKLTQNRKIGDEISEDEHELVIYMKNGLVCSVNLKVFY